MLFLPQWTGATALTMSMMELPFQLETDLERKIAADPEWQQGVLWGEPRPGHNEGQVMYHIADVLTNVDCFNS